MRNLSLTTSSEQVEGRACHVYEYDGRRYLIHDDAQNVLTIIELFRDESISPIEKFSRLIKALFADPDNAIETAGDGFSRLLPEIVWDVCGLDIDGSHTDDCTGDVVIDWEHDADYIRMTLMQGYGVMWDEVRDRITYGELCSMLSMAPSDTPMGQALYYRTASEPEKTKYNEKVIEDFRDRKRFWSLGQKTQSVDMNARLNSMFEGIARRSSDGL